MHAAVITLVSAVSAIHQYPNHCVSCPQPQHNARPPHYRQQDLPVYSPHVPSNPHQIPFDHPPPFSDPLHHPPMNADLPANHGRQKDHGVLSSTGRAFVALAKKMQRGTRYSTRFIVDGTKGAYAEKQRLKTRQND